MKIGILTASFLPKIGGAQVFSYNIGRYLSNSGHTVNTYIPIENYRELNTNFRSSLIPLPPKFYGAVRKIPYLGLKRARQYLINQQNNQEYDVWLIVATYPSGYVAACLKDHVPIVLRASGEDIQKSSELNYGLRLNRSNEKRIAKTLQSYDHLAALTKSVVKDYLDLNVNEKSITILPNGVDLDWFKPKLTTAAIRKNLSWPIDKDIILTTGRNHPKKGYDMIPYIANSLRSRGLPFKWYVVGLGTDQINRELVSLNLNDHVETINEIGVTSESHPELKFPDQQLVNMYQAADIYAFPSMLETFGMVQLEAMAAGTAVVSTDAPGCKDVVTHMDNGLQAISGDKESFTNQVATLLENKQLRKSLSDRASNFVNDYGWPSIASKYESVFEKTIYDWRTI